MDLENYHYICKFSHSSQHIECVDVFPVDVFIVKQPGVVFIVNYPVVNECEVASVVVGGLMSWLSRRVKELQKCVPERFE